MSSPDPAPLVCPACRSTSTHVGASGLALCFECAEQWDPDLVTALAAPAVAPFAMAPVEEVYGPTDADVAAHPANVPGPADVVGWIADAGDPETHRDRMEAMIGGTATLEGGQRGIVRAFTDSEGVVIELTDGRTEIVSLSDVERIIEPPADDFAAPEPTEGNEQAAAVQMTAELAVLIVKAAVASMPGVLSPEETDVSPIGFLPDDPGLFPIVEQAAIQAVRGVIAVFDLDAAALLEAIGAG